MAVRCRALGGPVAGAESRGSGRGRARGSRDSGFACVCRVAQGSAGLWRGGGRGWTGRGAGCLAPALGPWARQCGRETRAGWAAVPGPARVLGDPGGDCSGDRPAPSPPPRRWKAPHLVQGPLEAVARQRGARHWEGAAAVVAGTQTASGRRPGHPPEASPSSSCPEVPGAAEGRTHHLPRPQHEKNKPYG